MGNDRLYQIMKEKEAIYAKEDFTEEDGNKASDPALRKIISDPV